MLENFESYKLALKIYRTCKTLTVPDFLRDQLDRASSSVVQNLAEGSGKRTALDQRKFYSTSFGSLKECQAILDMEEIENPELREQMRHLGAMIFGLMKACSRRHSIEKGVPAPNKNPNENENA